MRLKETDCGFEKRFASRVEAPQIGYYWPPYSFSSRTAYIGRIRKGRFWLDMSFDGAIYRNSIKVLYGRAEEADGKVVLRYAYTVSPIFLWKLFVSCVFIFCLVFVFMGRVVGFVPQTVMAAALFACAAFVLFFLGHLLLDFVFVKLFGRNKEKELEKFLNYLADDGKS